MRAGIAELAAEIVSLLRAEYAASGDRAYLHAAALAENAGNRARRSQDATVTPSEGGDKQMARTGESRGSQPATAPAPPRAGHQPPE